MNFYMFDSREGYVGYDWDKSDKELVGTPEIVGSYREIAKSPLSEYVWDGMPKKRSKQGDFHVSCGHVFANSSALKLIADAAMGKIDVHKISLVGREKEEFWQVFILNFVDCLDVKNTVAGPAGGYWKKKIGVIKKPKFDENRWDGSQLFAVPEDPSYKWFCSEDFVLQWKDAKLKGAMFSRQYFDLEPILA